MKSLGAKEVLVQTEKGAGGRRESGCWKEEEPFPWSEKVPGSCPYHRTQYTVGEVIFDGLFEDLLHMLQDL